MKWRDQWQLSFRNIFSAPVRSLLTVLGMSIGIGAILAVSDAGHGGTESGQGRNDPAGH